MKFIRTHTAKFIVLVLALQILNLSVYGNEYMQAVCDENGNTSLTKNQIDSLVEYVVEEVVAHRNVFPERKGNHTKNESKLVKAPFQVFVPHQIVKPVCKSYGIAIKYALFRIQYNYLYSKEINPPPPKLV